MKKEETTAAELLLLVNLDMTLTDILRDLAWASKERLRCKEKCKKQRLARKAPAEAATQAPAPNEPGSTV